MFVLNSVGLIQRVRVLHCCVVLWALAVFRGHTAEWSYCDGHLAFRSIVPAQPFFPTSNTGHPPNFSTLALNCAFTQSTAWHHVNHGQHPFFPDQLPWSLLWGRQGVSIVESACPEVLGKLMQILKNHTHRWLFPNKTFNYLSFGEVHWCSLSPHYFLWGCNFYFLSDNLFSFFFYEKSNRSQKKIGGGLGRKSPLMTGQLKYRVKIQSAFDIL